MVYARHYRILFSEISGGKAKTIGKYSIRPFNLITIEWMHRIPPTQSCCCRTNKFNWKSIWWSEIIGRNSFIISIEREDNKPASALNPAYLWLPSKRLRVWHQRELFISRKKRSLITSCSELKFIYLICSPRPRFMSINGDERLRTITHKATRVLHKHSTWMKWMMPEISLSRDLLSFDLFSPAFPPKASSRVS